jgi:hypothetical protein
MSTQRLSICVPCGDTVKTEFSYSLSKLMAVLSANDVQVHLHMRKGSLIAEQRQQLAEESKTVGSQEILWLDSDMQFPFDLYKRLHT